MNKRKCPGSKIRSKGLGKGLGIGKGKGPRGRPCQHWRRLRSGRIIIVNKGVRKKRRK